MPYDKSLDEEIFTETKEFGDTRIKVSVFSYNKGQKKLQLSRENNIDGWRFVRLGRLSKEDLEGALPVIQKAMETM